MTEPMGDEGQEGRKRIEFDEESEEDNDSQDKASERPKVAERSDENNEKHLANIVKALQGKLKNAAVTSLKIAETDLQKYKKAEQERAAQEVEGPKQGPDSIRKITGKRKVATPGPPTYETPTGKKNKITRTVISASALAITIALSVYIFSVFSALTMRFSHVQG